MSYGLDSTGFTIKRFEDIKAEVDADLTSAFGNIRTDTESVFGQLSAIFSKKLSDLWELVEQVWQSYSLMSEGISLDNVVQFSGINRLPAVKSTVTMKFIGTGGTVIPVGTIVRSSVTNKQFVLNSIVNLSITTPAGTMLPFIATEYGPVIADVGTITQLVTPISGITSITNEDPALIGRDTETDDALRYRFIQARTNLGYARWSAVLNRILQEVAGVVTANIVENATDTTDSDGRPPHSFEAIVDCSLAAEQSVAQKIFDTKPLGIASCGTGVYTVSDSQGGSHIIKFSKVETYYAWVKAILTYSSEVAFPADGTDQIKNAVVVFGNKFKAGNDLIVQAMNYPVFSVPGIVSATIQIAVTAAPDDLPSWSPSDIAVAANRKLIFDTAQVIIL